MKRLEAAEHVCRCFRQGLSYAATQNLNFEMAMGWLMVWMQNAPKSVLVIEPIRAPKKRV
jgi:hypothetical protein